MALPASALPPAIRPGAASCLRQTDSKDAARVLPARYRQRSSVQREITFCKCQPQAHPLVSPRLAGVLLREWLEQPWKIGRVNTDPGVLDIHTDRAVSLAKNPHYDPAALSKFNCVIQQVPQSLPKAVFVDRDSDFRILDLA